MPYYIVPNSSNLEIYTSWSDTQNFMRKNKGSSSRKFDTLKDAKECVDKIKRFIIKNPIETQDELDKGECAVYVDGSFKDSSNTYGYGVVLLSRDKEVELHGRDNNPFLLQNRNVAGELIATQIGILKAIELGFKKVYVHHDYIGISDWVTGVFKTDSEISKIYVQDISNYLKYIDIKFIKVKGHSGIKYNEIADRLAGLD